MSERTDPPVLIDVRGKGKVFAIMHKSSYNENAGTVIDVSIPDGVRGGIYYSKESLIRDLEKWGVNYRGKI